MVDNKIVDQLVKNLNESLRDKMVKVASKNGFTDLEFGISGLPWRIRAGECIEW